MSTRHGLMLALLSLLLARCTNRPTDGDLHVLGPDDPRTEDDRGVEPGSERGTVMDTTPEDSPEPRGPRGIAPQDEIVVLVHGLMRSSMSMAMLGSRLRDAGFRTEGFDYPSTRESVAANGGRLRTLLTDLDADSEVARIHLVTHSMGALIARAALAESTPQKVQRMVMLAPPNAGSDLARWLEPVLGGVLAPLGDLSNADGSAARSLPIPAAVEIGVIAASMDHAVSEELTHIEGESDHKIVTGMHSFLMYQPSVAADVVEFLRKGRFRRGEDSP